MDDGYDDDGPETEAGPDSRVQRRERADERLDDLKAQRQELAAVDSSRDATKIRVVVALAVILGVLGLIVGAVGFTVGYTKTKDQASAGVSLAQQIDALCTADPAQLPASSQKLCDDAEDVVKGDPGPVGDQGPPGPQGQQGIQGYQGVAGQQGPAGAGGPPGPKGAKGDLGGNGPAGTPGSAGAKGEKGDEGSVGPAGAKGEKGDKGDVGDKGDKGEKGEPGDPAFPFSFSFTTTDLMGPHVFTVTCTAPGACDVVES